MKQLIIIMGTILLGCIIFEMMAGGQPGSLRFVSAEAMRRTVEAYG